MRKLIIASLMLALTSCAAQVEVYPKDTVAAPLVVVMESAGSKTRIVHVSPTELAGGKFRFRSPRIDVGFKCF